MRECDVMFNLCDRLVRDSSPSANVLMEAWKCRTSPRVPAMQMFLHWGTLDYVLFESWVPRTSLQFFLTLLLSASLGYISQFLRAFRTQNENRYWGECTVDSVGFPSSREACTINAQRAALLSVIALNDLVVMLIAMSFNGWFILAIVVGTFAGALCFAHVSNKRDKNGQLYTHC